MNIYNIKKIFFFSNQSKIHIKTIKLSFIFIIGLMFFSVFVDANTSYSISHYNTLSGLKSNRTVRIIEDKHGFYWFGTIKGVQRFDGYEYQEFAVYSDTSELSNNFEVYKFFLTPDSTLLVGTSIGLLLFDDNELHFRLIPFDEENNEYRVTDICMIDDSTFFTNSHSAKGVFIYKHNRQVMHHAHSQNDSLMNSPLIRLVLKGPDNKYFFHISYDLYIYDISYDTFTKCNTDVISPATYFHYGLTDINDNFWLLSGLGIYFMAPNGNLERITDIDKYCSPSKQIGSSIIQATDSSIYVGINWWGVLEICIYTQKVKRVIRKNDNTLTKLTSNQIYTLYKAKDQALWWCSDGAYRIKPNDTNFEFIASGTSEATMNYAVLSILEDSNGKIWIGTDGGGLHQYIAGENKTIPAQQIKNLNLPKSKVITSLFEDKEDKELWIGTYGDGLYVFNYERNKLKHYKYNTNDTNSVQNNNIWWFFKDTNGDIVTTSYCKSVNIYRKKTKSWKHLSQENGMLKGNCVTAAGRDENGQVWFAYTEEGLDMYGEIEQRTLNNIISSRDRILSLCFHGDTILLGCFSGIKAYSKSANSFIEHTLIPFFNNVKIYNIFKDSQARFWIASEKGLFYFRDGDQNPTYSIYNKYFGENIARTIFETKNKTLLIGGINGLLNIKSTKADNFEISDFYIYLTDLKIFGKSYSIKDSKGNSVALDNIDYLKLPYTKNYLEISFSTLNLDLTDVVEYEIKVDNFYPNWKTLEFGKNKIDLPSLKAGMYQVEIKGTMKGNDSNFAYRKLTIEIIPPFWETLWFKIIIILIIIFIIIGYIWQRTNNLRKQKIILEQQVSERTKHIVKQKEELAIQAETLEDQYLSLVNKQEELETIIQALEISNTSKNRLFGIIAHDLKSPFSGVSGLIKVLLTNLDSFSNDKLREYLEASVSSIISIEALLENLLQWTMVQQESIQINPTDINLQHIISEAIEPLKLSARNKKLNVEIQANTTIMAYADYNSILITIRNIIQNAIKFTPQYGNIIIKVLEENNFASIKIIDSGAGIKPDLIKKILNNEKLKSEYGTSGEKGTGLGLEVCKDFIKRNNGLLEIKSIPDEGTTFIINLPISQNNVQFTNNKEIEINHSSKNKEPIQDIKIDISLLDDTIILIAEDNPFIREHLVTIFPKNSTVLEASNGKEAYEIALSMLPDIIISDVAMPLMTGFELCNNIANNPITTHIPIILLTAKTDLASQMDGLSRGAIDYITKPFNEQELLHKLCNITKLHKQMQQNIKERLQIIPAKESCNLYDDPLIQKMYSLLETHLANPELTVELLSTELSMSRATLFRKLKQIINKSATEIITEYRMKRAMELLKENNYYVSEVAYMVGYNDPNYFTRKFKEYFGYLPSEV